MLPIQLTLPDSFLDEEVRDGFLVSSQMKHVWAVELDLLNEFIKICKKHNIQFYAAGGTMLGAVRHKGIIPWDDDIDVMMLRSEFEKFCKIAPQEFQHPYFFQTEETDHGCYRGHAQLRNSLTTGVLASGFDEKKNINQGIFIDIFPLDNVPDIGKASFYKKLKKLSWKCYAFQRRGLKKAFKGDRQMYKQWYDNLWKLCPSLALEICDRYYKRYEKTVIMYNSQQTKEVMMTPFHEDRWTWNRSDLNSSFEIPFEMLSIPVPKEYANMLTKTYGNWEKFVVGTSVHGGVIFDVEHPYQEYLAHQENK